jgi:Xaa-Pro aminopeptidase
MFNKEKYEKLFDLMAVNKLDALMIGPSSDLEYLIDYHAHVCERLNVLVLLKDQSYFHIAPLINGEEAKDKYPDDAKFYVWSDGEGFLETVKKSFEDHDLIGKTIGINEAVRGIDVIDFQNLFSAKFMNAHPIMEAYRVIKSKEDIAFMKKAAEIADQVMVDIKAFMKPGMFEYQVTDEIKRLYKVYGSQGISFDPIVATGKNSSRPHYNEGTSQIQIGDTIVVDCGCRVNNMCSDTSRTFFMGEPSDHQREIYEICKAATLKAQNFAKEGVTAGEVDAQARNIIESKGYGAYFLNRTGHGIGFSVHEAPYMKPNSPQVLENGMAFSIEPGIYLPKTFGMRVENIVLIEKGQGVSLNHSPIDLEDMIITVKE